MKLKKNIGPKNRIARLVAGLLLVLAGLFYLDQSNLSLAGIALGIILILEAAFSFCVVHGIRGTKDMR